MARPRKNGVDYFSHDTTSGKTIFTLESQYGNDGYAFWFKLLELLGTQLGHSYNCNNTADWLFLVAKTRITPEKAEDILNTLAQLDAIDDELWNEKIIWSQNFVDRLADVYKKRGTETPQKPGFCDGNSSTTGVTVPESTQRKVKEIKANEIIEKGDNTPIAERSAPVPYEKIHELFNEIAVSYPKITKLSDQRKKAIGTRWRETPDLETFEQLFKKAEASPFLKGDNDRNWRASFDWLLKPANMIKVLEGNYDAATSTSNGNGRPATTPEAFSLSGFKTTDDE